MANLEHGQLVTIDGGVFRTRYNEEDERFELWTHNGRSGLVVGRMGFDVGPGGVLSHRVYDVEAEKHILFTSNLTVDDLELVGERMKNGYSQYLRGHLLSVTSMIIPGGSF